MLNSISNPKPTVKTLESPSNPTITSSPYFQILIIARLCGIIVFYFFTMPTTNTVYLLLLAYYILHLKRNPAKPPKTVGSYSKYFPFVFPASYLLLSTYMI